MTATALLTINDGGGVTTISSWAMLNGSVSRRETETGNGVIEYANGSAERWVRFEARQLTVSGSGPVPHGLWALDLTAASWAVTVSSFDNDGTTDSYTVIPARPQETRDINTGRTAWSLTLRMAAAET